MKNNQLRTIDNIPEIGIVYRMLKPLSELYPDFSNWYWDKVVPGVINRSDKIIIMESNKNIVGVSILKDGDEKKLRAIRIVDKYQKRGYGLHLIDESLRILGVDKPIVSVADEMINEYSRMFINRYGFDVTHVYNGLYRKHHLEYEFNGVKQLDKKSILF